MGASDFSQYQKGSAVADAFHDAVENARFEHGSGGYSGTLAEKGDYVVLERTPLERSAAYALADRLMSADDPRISDKWGPAGAIPVAADDCFRKRTVTVKLTYRGDHSYEDLQRFVRMEIGKVKRKDGETIGAHKIVGQDTKCRVEAAANDGKAEIRYYAENAPYNFRHRDWNSGAKSLAEARAAAVEFAKTDGRTSYNGAVDFNIVGTTRRETGTALVTVKKVPVKTELTVEVEVVKPISYSNIAEGWLFIGWASS